MELLYLWLEEEIVIRNKGFNFSGAYKVDQIIDTESKTATITVTENDNTIETFFGNQIQNLTAIVGANGVGKSTLLDFLIRLLTNNTYLGEKWIALFFDPASKTIFTYHTLFELNKQQKIENVWKVSIDNRGKKAITGNPEHVQLVYNFHNTPNDWSLPFLKTTKLIFYSPAFDLRNYPDKVKNNKNYEDVSTNQLLYSDSENDYEKHFDQIELHRFRNTLRQFQLAQSDLADLKELKIPTEIQVLFRKTTKVDESDLGSETSGVYRFLRDLGSKNGHKCNDLIEDAKKTRKYINVQKARLEKVKSWFLVNLIDNFFDNLSGYKDLHDKMFHVSLEEIRSEDFFTSVKNTFSKQNWIQKSQFDFLEFIDLVISTIDKAAILDHELPDNESHFYLPVSKAKDLYQWHFRYLQIFQTLRESFRKGFMELNWRDLSTGEKAYLDLYSRLFYAYRKITSKYGDDTEFENDQDDDPENAQPLTFIYILLDEAELGFHPLWQRQFIHSLVTFLNKLTDTKMQVLLTSHSPFVLSDLPKDNIILLAKNNDDLMEVARLENKSETFAANIHELFSDSFFMGTGLLGKYASDFIEQLIKELNSQKGKYIDAAQYEKLERKIRMVGEPIIHSRLNEMLSELKVTESTEAEIARLEEQLVKARKKLGG